MSAEQLWKSIAHARATSDDCIPPLADWKRSAEAAVARNRAAALGAASPSRSCPVGLRNIRGSKPRIARARTPTAGSAAEAWGVFWTIKSFKNALKTNTFSTFPLLGSTGSELGAKLGQLRPNLVPTSANLRQSELKVKPKYPKMTPKCCKMTPKWFKADTRGL